MPSTSASGSTRLLYTRVPLLCPVVLQLPKILAAIKSKPALGSGFPNFLMVTARVLHSAWAVNPHPLHFDVHTMSGSVLTEEYYGIFKLPLILVIHFHERLNDLCEPRRRKAERGIWKILPGMKSSKETSRWSLPMEDIAVKLIWCSKMIVDHSGVERASVFGSRTSSKVAPSQQWSYSDKNGWK